MTLIVYFERDPKLTKCPECGRDLIRTASGKRLCAYVEDHKSGVPLFERPAEELEGKA